MGLNDVLNTARDALAAHSYGLGISGQNVSNVNTPGYVRREAILESRALGTQANGTVVASGLRRIADLYTEQKHYASIGLSASAQHSDRLLGHVEALFDVSTGIDVGSALDELFSAFSTLATDPSNLSVRETVVGKARAFTSQLNGTADAVASFRTDLVSQALGVTGQVNQLTSQIAKLTEKISTAEGVGHDAADLKDQRDGALLKLSELVDVRVFPNNQGQLVVQGAGTTLVEGNVARSLDVGIATDGSLEIRARSKSGSSTDVSRFVQGGQLGSIRELHNTHTREVLDSLDQFALDVATAINDAHASGFDLNGDAGGEFFDLSNGPSGLARSLALSETLSAETLAASATAGGVPGDGDNALALAQLRTQTIANGGTRRATEAYGSIVSDVGLRRATASSDAELREAMEAQMFSMRESISGVSLDEEMVSLTKYQRAYEAASKVIATVDELLADLIRTLGR